MESSMNLSDVYVFKKVALTLSFSKAARQIGISRSAVSKQVSRLEKNLGVVLLNRTTRSVNLTEAGRTFDTHTARIDTKIEHAADLVRGADLNPLGTVSFTMPSGLGAALMPALASQFHQRWPELRLNVHFDDHIQDVIGNNLDLAIRISKKLTDSSLISRRLASTRKVLAASPGYLQKHGCPESLSDLENHRCLGRGSAVKHGTTWRLKEGDKVVDVPTKFALSTNNNLALVLAACLDAGIIFVPEICIAGELARGQLQLISCCMDPDPYGVYALYPHRNAAAKVKVLVDFIEDMLPNVASRNRWVPLEDLVIEGNSADDLAGLLGKKTHVA
jgi:DNA-binding transcriptional LysR family regulator